MYIFLIIIPFILAKNVTFEEKKTSGIAFYKVLVKGTVSQEKFSN